MKKFKSPLSQIVFVIGMVFINTASISWAAGDMTSQEPVKIEMQLGNQDGDLRFFPDYIELETGKLYLLNLTNPSDKKHYFSSDKFSRSVFTRKVQVNQKGGTAMVEVKGSIREIEVYPGSSAQWWFVPVKAGDISDLKCTIKGHAKKGMKGKISIR